MTKVNWWVQCGKLGEKSYFHFSEQPSFEILLRDTVHCLENPTHLEETDMFRNQTRYGLPPTLRLAPHDNTLKVFVSL